MTAVQNGGDDRNESRPPPLRSVHTTNLPGILDQFGMSLLVTTYQAGKLVVVRRDADDHTHVARRPGKQRTQQ